MTERRDDSSSWGRQWEIFHAALERPAAERAEFLAQECPDVELRREVEELLAAHDGDTGPLDKTLRVPSIDAVDDDASEQLTLLQESANTLSPGTQLNDRFEIVQLLGQGGMGSVYEAEDRSLETRVALKILRPEISASASAHQRFRREIQLARQVTHPNVCRIFDLFQDGALSFLTMELLRGETLRRRIQDYGPLSTEEALPWVAQICAGLSAAHEVGIIHRDLKTANIMLVETDDATRIVITDFGLARTAGVGGADGDQLTVTGQVLGTPAYMAPEQLEGGAVSPATDIYSLGVVLFELVTGRLPLEGETPFSIVARRLREPAPSPRTHLPDLNANWEHVILRCLERDPRERPRSPQEVAAALKGEAVPERWSPRKRRRLVAALGAVALLATMAISFGPRFLSRDTPKATEDVTPAKPDWLLIADFDNQTGEEILDGTLEAALRRELASSRFVNVASPERVGDTLALMARPVDTRVDATVAREVALRDGGIRAVLTGRVEKLGPSYLLSAELLDPSEGVILASLTEEADGQEAILPAMGRLSNRVRENLGEGLPTIEGSDEALSRVSTPSLRALRLYSRADRLIAMGGHEVAEELLREAIAQDPDFASSYTHLAWVLRNQNRPPNEFLPYAEKALEISERATVAERYFIRGSYYHMRSISTQKDEDAEAALAQYRALLQIDPGHFWASVNTPDVLRSLGRGGETLELFLQLVEARPNDFRIVALAARELVVAGGDLEAARKYVERARRLQEQGATEVGYLNAFLEFFPVHELWVRGEAERLVQEVDAIVDSLVERTAAERGDLAFEALGYYLDLGMFGKAEKLQTLYGLYSPGGWETLMAWRRRDRERLRELPGGPPDDTDVVRTSSRAFNLSVLGFHEDADQFLGKVPPEPGLVAEGNALAAKGILDFARNRHEEAIPALEEAIALLRQRQPLGNYFFAVGFLSRAWVALERPERGVTALEEASRQKPRLQWGRAYWMESQLRLAQLYREVGREPEAQVIEDELRRYCAWAEGGFPVLQGLASATDP